MSRNERDYDYYILFLIMCGYFLSVMEGSDSVISEAYDLMKAHGVVDEDGFPTYIEE